MKLIPLALLTAMMATPSALAATDSVATETAQQIMRSYLPGTTGFGAVKVNDIDVNKSKRTITVECNGNTTYIPFTAESLASAKASILDAMGSDYKKYKVIIKAGDKNLDDLVLFAKKRNVGPKEKGRFITRVDAPEAPAGLDGSNIAMWQSHGWYFEPKLNRWEWQRARIFQTVEDLYTQSYVMPFLMPMLENAGAYVMSPRERDTNLTEIIIDAETPGYDAKYAEANGSQQWADAAKPGFAYDGKDLTNDVNPFRNGKARKVATARKGKELSTATWQANIPARNNYSVYVSYVTEPNSTREAHYRVNAADGPHDFIIDQNMGGGTWIYLGHFPLDKGNQTVVELTNAGSKSKSVVTADAVKIGGGMGNVARIVKEPLDSIDYRYVKSNYPRFVEGARYFLQWAGAPDSVYTPSDNVNDYGDDYKSRGLWVNWLAGGSSMLPDREGLNIPVDLSFAFHSDAGTTLNDSIIGTLGIYCTKGDILGNGSSRYASRDLTDLVMTNIVNDVRRSFEPNWTRRGMWDQSYFEARVPEVPAMLLELLSHQNFADMKYGLDPEFRFLVSRAIYKGMLQFIAKRDNRPYVVQPLPVNSFAITMTSDARRRPSSYRLSWAETVDSLESTATPTYYIIQERIGDGTFKAIDRVESPEYEVTITDSEIHSYRIIAGNDGGVSFPSEVLALCDLGNNSPRVMIVNGFTRISAPDWFDSGEIAGFYDQRDHGVPYMNDISFIGSMFEYRRNIPWMDDDAAGFGASRADYEDKVIAGNTFDYVYTHGAAIRDAGYSFISTSAQAWAAKADNDDTYKIVDLVLGKQKEIKKGRGVFGTRYKAFPTELQNKITAFTAAGGSIFVSGSYIATDIWDNPFSSKEVAEADKKFATEVLGYHWRVGQASVTGEAYQVDNRFKAFTGGEFEFSNKLNEELYAVESPDSFYAPDPKRGCTIMRYTENNLVAGTAFDAGNYRSVAIGFPFETIKNAGKRSHLMSEVLNFLSNK